jgi:hypothetical protein
MFQTIFNMATKVATVVQTAFGISVEGTAIGFKVLRGAIISTGIGALIVGVGMLINAIVDWIGSNDEAAKKQEEVNKGLKQATELYEANQKAIEFNGQMLQKDAKLRGDNAVQVAEITRGTEEVKRKATEAELNRMRAQWEFMKTSEDVSTEQFNKFVEQFNKLKGKLDEQTNAVALAGKDVQIAQKEMDDEAEKKAEERANKAREKATQRADANRKQIEADTKANNSAKKKAEDDIKLLNIVDEEARAKRKIEMDFENAKAEIENAKGTTKSKNELIAQLEIKKNLELRAIREKEKLALAEENQKALDEAQALADENYLNSIANTNARAKAKIELDYNNRVEEINAMKISEFEKTSLLQQEEAKRNQLIRDLKAQEKATEAESLLDTASNDQLSFDARLQAITDREAMKNQIVFASDAERVAFEKANSDARIQIAEEEHKSKVQFAQDIGNAMGALSDVIGKETAVGKALAVGQATINTFLGATEVLRAKTVLPEPMGTISKIVNVAAIIATGIKSVKSILATKVKGSGGAGGSVPSGSVTAPVQPQLGSTAINQQMVNNLASANATQRSYVLESDVSNGQERIQRLNRAARIN